MAAPSLKALFEELKETRDKAAALTREAAPFADRSKQLAAEILERLTSSGKTHHKAAGLIATIEEKPASVEWAKEFLKAHGPDEVNALKAAAGTKQTIKITEA